MLLMRVDWNEFGHELLVLGIGRMIRDRERVLIYIYLGKGRVMHDWLIIRWMNKGRVSNRVHLIVRLWKVVNLEGLNARWRS